MDFKPSSTLIDPNTKLGLCEEDSSTNKRYYQQLLGYLIYLNHTRLDMAFVVGLLSQFMHNPKETHLHVAHRVMAYLKGIAGQGLLFKRGGGTSIEVYIDADHGGSIIDQRSTFDYCTFLGGNLVTWRSNKQDVVSRFNAEANYQAISYGIQEVTRVNKNLNNLIIW